MTSTAHAAVKMQQAHERALDVLTEHGSSERAERLSAAQSPTIKRPVHLASYQAEIVAGLAEIVEGQAERIAELEEARKSAKK